MALLPTADEAAGFHDLAAAREWAGVSPAVWAAVEGVIGVGATARIFASLGPERVKSAVGSAEVPGAAEAEARALTVVEKAAVYLLARAVRVRFGLPDIDPDAPVPVLAPLVVDTTAGPGADTQGAKGGRKVKVATVLDPADESEITPITQGEVDDHFAVILRRRGGPAREAAEPTADQIAAMRARVLGHGDAPYADFSILTPFGRRLQKHLRTRSWVMSPTGL